MRALPMALRDALQHEFEDSFLTLAPAETRRSGQAEKTLFTVPGGGGIETVRLHYRQGWASYCISSQAGCRFGCAFCATGAAGFRRDLSADEITDQLLYYRLQGRTIDSVSFMGMGEALANPAVFEAIHTLAAPGLFGMGQRRITVSTVGFVPGMCRLTDTFPQVNLAVSIHSPFDGQRSELMPINRQYPLAEVMDAIDRHIAHTGRRVFLAYLLLGGVNDSAAHAGALAGRILRLQGARLCHVDLIAYNPAPHAREMFRRPDGDRMQEFRRRLEQQGVSAAVRTQFGADIGAACGQLAGGHSRRKAGW